ncbi:MAG: MATE family efflux transporter [Clostridia bacterium]|nr:MATE family efflux transporter [Clostridia bacterium]MBR7092177.1 MATE family efflux transporter [Clostridia bacterium]
MADRSEAKYIRLTTAPVPGLVCSLAIPTICSMLITSLYNMADTFFVAGLQNDSATAAVGIAFPLMSVLQAIGFTFGHGSGNYISRKLGSRDIEAANRMSAIGFFSALFTGLLLTLAGFCFLSPMVDLLGATPTIRPYAMDYIRLILCGAPYMTAALVLNNQLRFQGNAVYGMVGIVSGAVINLGLDPLLIYGCGMGIAGAALATIISQLISFGLLLIGHRRSGILRLSIRCFRPSAEMYKEILRGGMPSLWRQGLASLSTVLLNRAAAPFSDAAVTAMTVVTRIDQFSFAALIGFGQGFQPVCGYNFGAGLYRRVRSAFFFCLQISVLALTALAAGLYVFAEPLLSPFCQDGPQVLAIGTAVLRCHVLTFPLLAFVILCNMLLQTIGRAVPASLLSASRQGLFLIPFLLVLPRLFGLEGLQWAQPAADLCSFALALPLGIRTLRTFRQDKT